MSLPPNDVTASLAFRLHWRVILQLAIQDCILGPISPTTISPFQVLTKDSVTISVDAVVYYRVSNATMCKTSVENAHHSTSLLSQVPVTAGCLSLYIYLD
jgi:regulator of protease activity HflC (stomatin/prohibitin superfamily)